MSLRMQRGKTGSLFAYMPEQTYNWQNRLGTFKGTADVDTRQMDIPRSWIKPALRRLIRPFANTAREAGVGFAGLETVERGRYELLEPRKLRGEFFPETFVCLACSRFFRGSSDGRTPHCHCGGKVEQWSFVEYHRCGHISGLLPPRCANNCRAPMRLLGRESRTFADWSWRCSGCGTRATRGVYHGCLNCRNGQVKISRPDANPVYQTQYVKVVNPPGEEYRTLLETDAIYSAAIAQALGTLPGGLQGLQQGVNDRDSGHSEQQTRRQLAEQFGITEDDPIIDQLLERQRNSRSSGGDWYSEVEQLGLEEERQRELGFQCVELSLASAASPVTLDDLVDHAPSATMKALYETEYRDTLARYGFSGVTLLREFPMAFVVAGYTRESRDPEPGVQFHFFQGESDLAPMYGQRTETEALLFKLDPDQVLRWLVGSSVIDDPGDVNPQAALFSMMEPVQSIFATPENRITASVLGLVHSAAHRALRAVALRSGLAADSLSEYLFPHNLAFLIYADTRSEFVMGGLEHVFRNHLHTSLQEMDAERRCVFDPPCRNHGGACAICMYLSENSCERFNTALSRNYLFGGDDGSVGWQPFWSV